MVLRVTLEDFPEAVKRYAQITDAFVATSSGGTVVSSVDPETGVIVSANSDLSTKEVRKLLEASGMHVREGEWSKEIEGDQHAGTYVAAVAYRGKEGAPGLWVEGYIRAPLVMDVLRRMFDEFATTGEAASATFEQFMKSAQPNVLILSPEELRAFAARSEA
jgi:hypothetical protein